MLEAYREGSGVDAIAGAEAIISHLVTRELGVPCAHAPSLPPLDVSPKLSPKAAAEELGYTFLPCVLVGLSGAPLLHRDEPSPHGRENSVLYGSDIDAVVAPIGACGGSAVMSLAAKGATVVAVKSNETSLKVLPEDLGIEAVTVSSSNLTSPSTTNLHFALNTPFLFNRSLFSVGEQLP